MRAVLSRPAFRLLFCGLLFSMTAESVLLLALAIWAKDLTGSNGMAGAAILAVVAPMAFAPVLGFVVDRFRRRPFLVAVLLCSAVMLTPLFAVHERGDLWILFSVGVGYGLSFIMVSAALNGLIKQVVPDDLLAEANGALQTVKQGLRLVGPLLGAGLYGATRGWGLAAVGITGFVLAALVISAVRVDERRPTRTELRWAAEVSAGVRQLVATAAMRRVLIGVVIAITVFGFGESVFFAYVDQGLHRPPTFLGVLISIQGVGGLLGGLTAAKVVRRFGEIGAITLGLALFTPWQFAGVLPRVWLAVPLVVLAGLGLPYTIVGLMTLLQRTTPTELMGRTSAAMDALLSAPQALSIAFGAALVGLVDYRILMTAMGVVMTVSAVYLWAGRGLTRPSAAVEPAADQVAGDGGAVRQAETVV
ncbi:MFS transporter [Catellatospora sp. TT07R-123]|uniref:MFS transporter n=1 Tax=Catellatospora sp. TT07R-123 TaxID=2733863 RepID=UPI001B2C7F3F|nr:MFS transporter [Catellatospora sp. TT07R-123]GHJ50194.1 MFS transporter [Catellatospora sp. TT07R-123]